MTAKEVGAILRMFREMSGYTQEGLAAKIHSNRNSISRIETGKDMPEVDVFVQWARVTGMSGVAKAYLAQLLDGDEQEKALLQYINALREVAAVMDKFKIA